MQSLYAKYINEREGRETLEDDFGFATFSIGEKTCYITDIYLVPEQRRLRKATELADRVVVIAKERGCNLLLGSIDPDTKGSHDSLLVLLQYGFILDSVQGSLVFFRKEI